jgi:hypothetical protein
MKGCWFWDEYSPACSIPLASSGAEAGVAEAGSEGGVDGAAPEAGSVDAGEAGASPCFPVGTIYPNVQPILSFDPSVGDMNTGGDQGSMQVQVPFTAYNQQSLVQWIFPAVIDLSGKTVFARVRFDSGGNPNPGSNPNGFRLVVKTGATAFAYGASQYFNLPPSGQTMFTEYDFPLTATPAGAAVGWDPTQVISIELEFDTGGGPAAGVDAGGGPSMVTFHVDTIGTVP